MCCCKTASFSLPFSIEAVGRVLKGNRGKDTSWPENVENVQIVSLHDVVLSILMQNKSFCPLN